MAERGVAPASRPPPPGALFDHRYRVLESLGECAFGAVLRVAQIGEKDVVHLQVAATGVIEGPHRLFIGGGYICCQYFDIGIVVTTNPRYLKLELAA